MALPQALRTRPSAAPDAGISVRAAVYLAFFLSGAASLTCQVVWFKQLQHVLGSSTFSVSVTVASFFLGLAVGSWLGGRWADRWQRPLLLYGLLEFALAITCVSVTVLLAGWERWAVWLVPVLRHEGGAAGTVTTSLAFLMLLPPTILMGATLPVLARYLVRRQQALAARIGVLYGLNTLGAAVGSGVVGFLLIGYLGVSRSSLVAGGIYAAIAVLAVVIARFSRDAGERPAPAAPQQTASGCQRGTAVAVLVAVFACSGFAAIAYEVLWFRILSNFGVHSVYAFSGMLATYLVGLVLGSIICAKFLAPRKERLLTYFARIQLLTAAGGVVSLALLGRSRNVLDTVFVLLEKAGMSPETMASTGDVIGFVGLCAIVLLVPATIIGMSFPLASELTIHHLGSLGRRLGRLYAVNTIGGVLGSLAAGFLLLPLLGSQASLLLVVGINVLLWGLVLVSQPALRRQGTLWREGLMGLAGLAVAAVLLGPRYLEQTMTKFEGGEVLAFREAPDATFVVLEYDTRELGRFQQLLVNGWSYANNNPMGRRYMGLLGHLPTLLHEQPKTATVICIGTGTTVGALTTHEDLEKIHAVDLSKHVFDFARHFEPLNHRFQRSPRVECVVADGRHFLLCTDERFDVVTAEPPPPNHAGVVSLYSREFYRIARRRMRKGGVLAQWVPLDFRRSELPKMLIKTLQAEFPHVSLWIGNRMEGVAIASLQPLAIDPAALRRRMAQPGVREDLESIGLETPEQLLATFVAADEALARFVGDAAEITDDRPRIGVLPPLRGRSADLRGDPRASRAGREVPGGRRRGRTGPCGRPNGCKTPSGGTTSCSPRETISRRVPSWTRRWRSTRRTRT